MIMIRNAVTQDSAKPALFGQGLDDALMALVDRGRCILKVVLEINFNKPLIFRHAL